MPMEPTEKSKAVDNTLTALTGVDRKATIRDGRCVFFGNGEVHSACDSELDFTDEQSVAEYRITGICQACQDRLYGYLADCEEEPDLDDDGEVVDLEEEDNTPLYEDDDEIFGHRRNHP